MLRQEETSTFADRIAKLLERVEYRRADSWKEREEIYRLRYEAYSREGYIEPNSSGIFTDSGDETPNAWLIGIYIDGVLASSIRLHLASRPQDYMTAMESFADLIEPKLSVGDLVLDATRHTSRLEFTRAYPFLPYVTMRCGFVAEDYFGVDYLMGTCRAEYQPAFRRMYGATTWSQPRPYPPLTRPHVLMGYDCKAKHQATRARYPFLNSTLAEQSVLFGRSSNGAHGFQPASTAERRERVFEGRQHSTTCAA